MLQLAERILTERAKGVKFTYLRDEAEKNNHVNGLQCVLYLTAQVSARWDPDRDLVILKMPHQTEDEFEALTKEYRKLFKRAPREAALA